MKATGIAMLLMMAAAQAETPVPPATDAEPQGRLLGKSFRDFTVVMFAKNEEPWVAFWNEPQQMARFENPTNGVTITAQYFPFPMDTALQRAAGDRDRFLDLALRKYCAALFSVTRDAEISTQPIDAKSRTVGDHYFRYCAMWARDRAGNKRNGYIYLMLRGRAEKPKFTGEMLLLTIGYPELIAPSEEKAALAAFDVILQNLSFL